MKADDELGIEINLKPLWDKQQKKNRYIVWPSGYVFDRLLSWLLIGFLVVGVAVLFIPDALAGESVKAYVRCPAATEFDIMGELCENPLYGRCDARACQPEFLHPGEEIGEPPSRAPARFGYATLFFIVVMFVWNHFSQKGRRYEDVRNKYNQQERSRRGSDK